MVVETLLDEAKICSFFIALEFKFRITVEPHDRRWESLQSIALGKYVFACVGLAGFHSRTKI